MLKALILMSILTLAPALTAHDPGTPTQGAQPAPPTPPAPTLPKDFFLAAAPANAKLVKDAKPTLKVGEKIVLTGRIGGSKSPFVKERAIFTLIDTRMKYCGQDNKEDKCKTPWDYCCDSRKDITANSVTIQVVDADGKPIKLELNGVKGLKPLAIVSVVGTVAKAEGESCIVNATGVFVAP